MNTMSALFKCPCCGYYTLDRRHYDLICPVCYWEDDFLQISEDEYSVCNHMSLAEARKNYQEFGACDFWLLKYVRNPNPNELSGADD